MASICSTDLRNVAQWETPNKKKYGEFITKKLDIISGTLQKKSIGKLENYYLIKECMIAIYSQTRL